MSRLSRRSGHLDSLTHLELTRLCSQPLAVISFDDANSDPPPWVSLDAIVIEYMDFGLRRSLRYLRILCPPNATPPPSVVAGYIRTSSQHPSQQQPQDQINEGREDECKGQEGQAKGRGHDQGQGQRTGQEYRQAQGQAETQPGAPPAETKHNDSQANGYAAGQRVAAPQPQPMDLPTANAVAAVYE